MDSPGGSSAEATFNDEEENNFDDEDDEDEIHGYAEGIDNLDLAQYDYYADLNPKTSV